MQTEKDVTDRYHFQGHLARGSYGEVYRAMDRATGETVAIKVVEVLRDTSRLLQEISNHARLEHSHVIKLREVRLVSEKEEPDEVAPEVCHGDRAMIVMDFAKRGTLRQEMVRRGGPLLESEARVVFTQLISAVEYCHNMDVVSRDIKLSNILLDDSPHKPGSLVVKLCDFGFSKSIRRSPELTSHVGTPDYVAPEILKGEVYDKSVDIWSCGVVLYMMVTGYKPFSSEPVPSLLSTHKIRGTLTKIVQADFKFPDDIELSNACQDLVVKCLTSDPKERINPHEIWRHPWICMSRYPP